MATNSTTISTNPTKNPNDDIELFSVAQKSGIEYFVNKNSYEKLRLYAFDEAKNILRNISSLVGNWENSVNPFKIISKEEYLENTKNRLSVNSLYELKRSSSEYLRNFVKFKDVTYKFDLTYTLFNNLLSHYAKINLVDFPTLSTYNTTLYLYNETNVLKIFVENGSGDFSVESSSEDLARVEYFDRVIAIFPKLQGVLTVSLRDNKLVNHLVSATVYISGIKEIRLTGGGLIQENRTITLGMKIYDNYNNQFSEDQIRCMQLKVSNFDNELEVIKDENYLVNSISLIGIVPNVYAFSVRNTNPNNRVRSNVVKIEVFARLEIFPPYLLMIPGSSYTLFIKGGPEKQQNIIRKYVMDNTTVATNGEDEPEVSAKIIGKTKFHVLLYMKDNSNTNAITNDNEIQPDNSFIICQESIHVTVAFPDSIEIEGAHNRKIYNKSTIRLLASLKLNKNTFTYAIAPIEYEWSLDHNHLAKLKNYISVGKNECLENAEQETCTNHKTKEISLINSVGIFLTGISTGTIEVKLNARINYPQPYSNHKPNMYQKQEKILIDDNLWVDIAEFYEYNPNKSSLYLLPHNIDHDLPTNKDKTNIKFEIVSQHKTDPMNYKTETTNLISLTDNGRITTYDKKGISYVMINQIEKDNKPFTPVILPIYVTDFYSIFVEKSYTLFDMELSQTMTLRVITQHEYGLQFAESKFNFVN